jgi:hypothetical protein
MMAFKFDEEKQMHYLADLKTSEGEFIYISQQSYDLFMKACEEGEPERDAQYKAMAAEAEVLAERALEIAGNLFVKHQRAKKEQAYDKAMRVVE